MSPQVLFGELMPLALAASLVAGLAGVVLLKLLLRLPCFKRSANARFILWFGMLVALSAVAPALFASGAAWMQRVPVVTVHSTMAKNVTPSLSENPEAIRAYWLRDYAVQWQANLPVRHELSARVDVSGVLGLLLLSGFLISLARIGLGLARLKRIVNGAEIVEMRATSRGPIRILAARALSVPIAVGYRRPVVVLPPAMLDLERDTDRENVLLHEIEHLHRFDDMSSLLQAVCMAMLWFNPFAYCIARQIGVEREMACDEAVVALTGKRVKYAATLWKIATNALNAPIPSLISAFSSGSHTVVRMKNLLSERAGAGNGRLSAAFALAAFLLVALLGSAAAAPAMLLPRGSITEFSTVRLDNGWMLVVGGRTPDGMAMRSAQLYDARNRRLAVIPMHLARWSAAATLLSDGDVLVAGGMTPAGATADAELYDVKRRVFEEVRSMNVARAEHTATLLRNGDVLIASGEGASGLVPQTEIYRAKLRRFQYTANGAPRVSQTALLIDNGDVLMFSGFARPGYMRCPVIYDSRLHTYRDAGTFLRAGRRSLMFELPDGRLVTHHIQSA